MTNERGVVHTRCARAVRVLSVVGLQEEPWKVSLLDSPFEAQAFTPSILRAKFLRPVSVLGLAAGIAKAHAIGKPTTPYKLVRSLGDLLAGHQTCHQVGVYSDGEAGRWTALLFTQEL